MTSLARLVRRARRLATRAATQVDAGGLDAAAGTLRDLRRTLRRIAVQIYNASRVITELELMARCVPKDGGTPPMDLNFSPSEQEDVLFRIDPKANGVPVAGPVNVVWGSSNSGSGSLAVADDRRSARLITATGSIDTTVTVTTLEGVQEFARVTRSSGDHGPIDSLGLSGSIIPKQ